MSSLLERVLREGAHLAANPSLRQKLPPEWTDPVAWVLNCGVKIETKTRGLIPFRPYPYQVDLMRRVAAGQSAIIDKSRQTGVTTAVAVTVAHELLYRQVRIGQPMHAHFIANKEEVAVQSVLKKARTALSTATLTDEQRRHLSGADPALSSTVVTYTTPEAQNYIRAHASNPDVGRSFDGNFVLMEEFAYMPFAETIYTGVKSMLDSPAAQMWIVSTYNGDGDFFCEMVDSAKQRGLLHIPIDWRAHPGRDQAWRETSLAEFAGREWMWRQEHELQRYSSGQQAVNLSLIRKLAQEVEWVGAEPLPLHRYSKGVDQAGKGADLTVHVAIDLTARPAQVVYAQERPRLSVPERVTEVEHLAERWPGPLWIDGTNEAAVPALVEAPEKTAVHFSGGQQGSERFDRNDRLRWRVVPREYMEASLAANLETGALRAHLDAFPELRAALRSWRRGEDKHARGRNVDYLDALLLANLSLTNRTGWGENVRVLELPNLGKARGLSRRKW